MFYNFSSDVFIKISSKIFKTIKDFVVHLAKNESDSCQRSRCSLTC